MAEVQLNGTYYEGTEPALRQQLEEIFTTNQKGPGAKPAPRLVGEEQEPTEPVKAIIVPHAPYKLAGPAMAWGYKTLAEEKQNSDLYIIVAQAQNSNQAGLTTQLFTTPLGQVRVDQELARTLLEKGHVEENDALHNEETNIKLQLPMLQYVSGMHKDKIKILPLFVNASTNMNELIIDLKEALMDQNKTANFIFVTNLTSYGRDFHYVPFTENIEENIMKLDKEFIEAIQGFDEKKFKELAQETTMHPSGYFALEFFFKYFSKGKLLLEQNYLSGDVNGNYKNTISYATMILK